MKYSALVLVVLLQVFVKYTFSRVLKENPICGYSSCHPTKDGFINVHIVPHTHDDVGWLKTLDQYYYGSKSNVQNAGVQYILDSVTDALKRDKTRRFIYVETAFFWKWWLEQNDAVKYQFKSYVDNGQLEFIGGAWSMNDEATTHYQSTIDQFTWGLRKLNDTFGTCGRPKIGWQIDPFGHSREMASIFTQLGFDALLLGRIDYEDKINRFKSKTPEMIWKGSSSLGPESNLFTGVMSNIYAAPPGFCFDILCNDEPIIDDPKNSEYNVDKKVTDFLNYVNTTSSSYTTNNIILTMGEDFHYQEANVWYKNLDKLIFHTNKLQEKGSKYNLIYSTPSCYVKAVHDEASKTNLSWPIKTDDFFPYASDPHSYWTGYFTSRPTLKRFERIGNNFLQVCKQLYALTKLEPENETNLNPLREAMGVMQHHDAVTGTEKENVAQDYAKILQQGFDECNIVTSAALNKLISEKPNQTKPNDEINFTSCLLTNVSSCAFSEKSNNFIVTVYNPLSRPVSQYIRLPVLGTAYGVKDSDGNMLTNELIPIAESILKIPGRNSSATVELIFVATDIPPLGFKSYYVEQISGNRVVKESRPNEHKFEDVSFDIDQDTGLVKQINMNGIEVPLKQQIAYYEGFVGNNKIAENRSSGAYIFRPLVNSQFNITSNKVNTKVFTSSLVVELQQYFNEWTSQIVRIYQNENFVEFDWLVGPLPDSEKTGIEVVSTFSTNLNTNSVFYTDSNGREMLQRTRNFRPTWSLNVNEPIAGNYYPVTSKILIRDDVKNIEVAVLTDRAQGGSSIVDGQIELMIHRKCINDDAFGVGEALMEEAFNQSLVARGSHYVLVGPISNGNSTIASLEKDLAQRKILSAWTFLSSTMGQSFDEYKTNYVMNFSGLKRNLPKNVQILTLEPWKEEFTYLLRLEHVYEINEDPIWSTPAQVELAGLFSPFEIRSIKETTLGANQWLADNHRLNFTTSDDQTDAHHHTVSKRVSDINASIDSCDSIITLNPMQIRTFVIGISNSNSDGNLFCNAPGI